MKKHLVLGTVLILAFIGTALVASTSSANQDEHYKYVGNSDTKVFHTLDCGHGKKIKEENRVYFETRNEAIEKGYRACKVCKP